MAVEQHISECDLPAGTQNEDTRLGYLRCDFGPVHREVGDRRLNHSYESVVCGASLARICEAPKIPRLVLAVFKTGSALIQEFESFLRAQAVADPARSDATVADRDWSGRLPLTLGLEPLRATRRTRSLVPVRHVMLFFCLACGSEEASVCAAAFVSVRW